ncbi:MAG TPA: hypothetical protein VIT66_14220 [Lysobacter sp.]
MPSWSTFVTGGYRPLRVALLLATGISIFLLCARSAGMALPQPIVWLGWAIIEVKAALKVAELAVFFRARKRSPNRPTREQGRPNPFLALLLTETRILRGFIDSWRQAAPANDGFTFRDGPEYQSMTFVLWLSLLVELPLVFTLLQVIPTLRPHRTAIDLVVLLITAYVLLAFRADRHAIRHSAHRIIGGRLSLRMGLRVGGDVSLSDITSVDTVKLGTWRSLSREWQLVGVPFAKISPLDKPNVVLNVRPQCAVLTWIHGGTSHPQRIGLYLDAPHAFLAELHVAIHGGAACTSQPSPRAGHAFSPPSPVCEKEGPDGG